jgi:hypothetical protein
LAGFGVSGGCSLLPAVIPATSIRRAMPDEGRDGPERWIPAFAGMTANKHHGRCKATTVRSHRANGFNRYQTRPNVTHYSSSDQLLAPPDVRTRARRAGRIAAAHKV